MYNSKKLDVKNRLDPQQQDSKLKNVRDSKSRPSIKSKESKVRSKTIPTRVFLYLKMESILNLPETENKMIVQLNHPKSTITKLEDHYTTSKEIDLSIFETYKPIFTVTIEQDSIDELNFFGNNPLGITLYELIPVRISLPLQTSSQTIDSISKESSLLVEYKPLSYGLVDLLPFFSLKRANFLVQTYLYPIESGSSEVAVRTVWQIYTLLPLLKTINFCNLAFITFESIYNISPEIAMKCDDLVCDISFQSKIRKKKGKFEKVKLCDFKSFVHEFIAQQNFNFTWENAFDRSVHNKKSLGLQTGSKLSKQKLFTKLFTTPNVYFNFNLIDHEEDTALISNSMQRFILIEDLSRKLEDIIAFNEQELLLELYDKNKPKRILLQGVIDLSIFMYPKVNAMRYAIALYPGEDRRNSRKSKGSSAKSITKSVISSFLQPKEKPTFAIVNICLLTPLTESVQPIHKPSVYMNECKSEKVAIQLQTKEEICEDTYRQFDLQVTALYNDILKYKIASIQDGKEYFTCQSQNLIDIVRKLIACDYNTRIPTKTSAEFMNLLTTVFNELTQRIYGVVEECDSNRESLNVKPNDKLQNIIDIVNIIKYMYEAGNISMGDFLLEKIKAKEPACPALNYYLHLYDVEKNNFESARKYYDRPLKERFLEGEYYCHIINIYICYMDDLVSEDNASEAPSNLMSALENLSTLFPLEVDNYVLLWCLYKRSNYLPGISYARFKFTCLFAAPQREPLILPISLYEMYLNYDPSTKTIIGFYIYGVAKRMLHLGLFKFGQYILQEIADEFTEAEKYQVLTTLETLLRETNDKFSAQTFSTEGMVDAEQFKGLNAQVNGNVQYSLNSIDDAMTYYESILDVKCDAFTMKNFQLGLFRYGYYMMSKKEYANAIKAFQYCCLDGAYNIIHKIEIGKSLYMLNRLPEAERYFAAATYYRMHLPDVWGYLALINMRRGQTLKALEFWKYAKLNPSNQISEFILEELDKINIDDVSLYLDMPYDKKITPSCESISK